MAKLIKMKCENCGADAKFSAETNVVECPFCGSASIIIESDEVKLAQIESEMQEREMQKHQRDDNTTRLLIFISVAMILIGLIGQYIA